MLNDHGALGHGDRNMRLRPRFVEKLKGVAIKKVVCGTDLTFAIDIRGRVYAWGKHFDAFPKLIDYFIQHDIHIVDVAPSHNRSVGRFVPNDTKDHGSDMSDELIFFLSDIGDVYWITPQSPIPKRFNPISEHFVVQISCGERYALFLTSDGEVYSWSTLTHLYSLLAL